MDTLVHKGLAQVCEEGNTIRQGPQNSLQYKRSVLSELNIPTARFNQTQSYSIHLLTLDS